MYVGCCGYGDERGVVLAHLEGHCCLAVGCVGHLGEVEPVAVVGLYQHGEGEVVLADVEPLVLYASQVRCLLPF